MTPDERYDGQIEHRINQLELSHREHDAAIRSLNTWRAFVLGSVAPIAVLFGAFAHEITLFLRNHA